ncbi:MAG TPA: sulfatase-like hydrolase/transferase, partial [Bacteroidales bacterium]|nr:sulfatase-like hydrolase/transferase [Bacteroidales bacterium]
IQQQAHTKKPNVILFLTDDNDFSYWGFGGGPKLSPNIDQLVADGIEATQFYASASVCTPSRYTLHTGRYAGRCQDTAFRKAFPSNEPYDITWNTFIDAGKEATLGEMLQKAGYTTGFVGKWHLGFDRSPYKFDLNADPYDPDVDKKLKAYQAAIIDHVKNTGYDYAASVVVQNNDNSPLKALRYHNLEWYAKGAIDFLDTIRNSDKPFFLIVNITTHHGPCHTESIDSDINLTQAGYVEGLDKIMPPRESIYERIMEKGYPVDFKTAGTVWTDDCVNAILDSLRRDGMTNNTAVIFTTDHNRYDGKATCYQGGVHIPFGMKWPGVIKPGSKTSKRMEIPDLYATIIEMAGGNLPEGVRLDSRSRLSDFVNATKADEDNEDLYFEFGYSRAVLSGNWKYIAVRFPEDLLNNMKEGKTEKSYSLRGQVTDEPCMLRYPYYFDADQLYNIKTDPEEQRNLAYDAEYQGKLTQMREKLKNITETFDNPFPVDNPDPFYTSDQYRKMNKKARDINMDKFYWYRKGCY